MTQPEIPALQEGLRQAEEGLYLAERLKKASMTNEKEFEECTHLILQSPEKLAAVLAELELDAELLLLKAIEDAKAVEADNAESSPLHRPVHRAPDGQRAWKRWSVVVAVIVPLGGAGVRVESLVRERRCHADRPPDGRVVQVPASDVEEFRDEPLVRVAASFNQQNLDQRFVIQGRACRFPVNAVLDLKRPELFHRLHP